MLFRKRLHQQANKVVCLVAIIPVFHHVSLSVTLPSCQSGPQGKTVQMNAAVLWHTMMTLNNTLTLPYFTPHQALLILLFPSKHLLYVGG